MSDEKKKEGADVKKELTPQQMQKRKKMLVYPLFCLVFILVMYLIFAPSGDESEKQQLGLNTELPIPKDDEIVGDKRLAYEREAAQQKEQAKMKSLQEFEFLLGDNNRQTTENESRLIDEGALLDETEASGSTAIKSSANAYNEINDVVEWYSRSSADAKEPSQSELEWRVQQLEKKLDGQAGFEAGVDVGGGVGVAEGVVATPKSAMDERLELVERSLQMAAKYMPGAATQAGVDTSANLALNEKVVVEPVSEVKHSVVTLLAAPMGDDELIEMFSKPRNFGFVTAEGSEQSLGKNTIRACVHKTVVVSNGKEVQLRLLEPMKAGRIVIPVNSIITGTAKIGGERMDIGISSIQYASNIIHIDVSVYDTDGLRGVFIPRSAEITAVKEVASNIGSSMGSSITINNDATSQLAADMARSTIQGASQYVSKKMQEVKVTLKANHQLLLLPKT